MIVGKILDGWLPFLSDPIAESETSRRRLMVAVGASLGAPICLLMTWVQYRAGAPIEALLFIAGFVLFTFGYGVTRSRFYNQYIPRILLFFLLVILISRILSNPSERSLFYLFMMPLIATYQFGMREGTVWSTVAFMLGLSIILFGETVGAGDRAAIAGDFASTYVVLFGFAIGFEHLRADALAKFTLRKEQLETERASLLEAQTELADREKKFRTYSALASDWLFELDEQLTFTFASPRLRELLGREITGSHIEDLKLENESAQQLRTYIRDHKEITDQQVEFHTPEGKLIVALISARPVYRTDGEFNGYIGAGNDVTKIQQAQEELRLKDQSLHHIQKLDALGQLTSGVAHDFNNLLMVIGGNLELMDRSSLPADEIAKLEAASRAADRAGDLTNHLLSFSRKQGLHPHTIPVKPFMSRLTEMLNRTLGSNLNIQSEVSADADCCVADESQLENAVLNLALNARDAMSGRGDLKLRADKFQLEADTPHLQAGEYVRIAVTDSGTGIEPGHLKRIMEPFFTTKPMGQGTGLGLSMVHGLSEQSGGWLDVASTPGIGSTFTIYLPAASQQLQETEQGNSLANPEAADRHIVLVEDDLPVQQVIMKNLTSSGYRVTPFNNAETALDSFPDKHPDLIITDLNLGNGMNGAEFATQLNQAHPHLPILLISGNADHVLSAEDIAAHPGGLLRKPFTAQQLRDTIEKLLL